jgi:hypothetical protein
MVTPMGWLTRCDAALELSCARDVDAVTTFSRGSRCNTNFAIAVQTSDVNKLPHGCIGREKSERCSA